MHHGVWSVFRIHHVMIMIGIILRIIWYIDHRPDQDQNHRSLSWSDILSEFYVSVLIIGKICQKEECNPLTGFNPFQVNFHWQVIDPVTHHAVEVLIIACPCELGLVTPMSVMVGVGRGAQVGVLIRDAESFEVMEKIDTLVVDDSAPEFDWV